MQIGEEYTVKIEDFSNLGYGIAKINGFVIFVENSCPQDIVKIKITKMTKNYAHASVIEIITPSPHRIKPFCPLQKVCGACQIQFIDYDYQLQLKRKIVQDTLKSIGNIDIRIPLPIPSPQTKNYRRKIQYPISQTKNSGRILAGYYKPKTHEIINIKYCPIQPEICDSIIDFIRIKAAELEISGYSEKKHLGELRHVLIRNSVYNNKNLVALVINNTKVSDKVKKLAKSIFDEFEEVSGVCVNFNTKQTNVILGKETKCLFGRDYIEEKIIDKIFKVGVNTFFQINPESAENIFKYVKNYIQSNFNNPIVLDAYAGITSFGIVISNVCKQVVSVEENKDSCKLAKEVIQSNNITNIEIHNLDAAKFFEQETRKYDAIILDPPRKGCTKESLDYAYKLAKDTIIYVSCNPATLARDLKYLTETKGCRIDTIQPFDMFCHTYHIENVAIIKV